MSEAKHTKGPWQEGALGLKGRYITSQERNKLVALAYDGGALSKSEAEANARLMTAAPDLLAACRFVIDFTTVDYAGVAMNAEQVAAIQDACRAAIAKAVGS